MNKIMILATLVAMTLVSSRASAALIIAYEDERASSTGGALEKLGDDVTAQAGDVLVITAAKSKGRVYAYDITSSDGGVASAGTFQAFDGTKTVDVVSFDITTGGTFDFDATPEATTFTTFGAYLLRADGAGESIVLLDSDGSFDAPGVTPNTSSFSFAQSTGIVIDAYSSGSATTIPAGLAGLANSSDKRITTTGTFTDVTSLSFDWPILDTSKNSRTGGVAYAVVPEPSTVALCAVGFAIAGLRTQRRHRLVA